MSWKARCVRSGSSTRVISVHLCSALQKHLIMSQHGWVNGDCRARGLREANRMWRTWVVRESCPLPRIAHGELNPIEPQPRPDTNTSTCWGNGGRRVPLSHLTVSTSRWGASLPSFGQPVHDRLLGNALAGRIELLQNGGWKDLVRLPMAHDLQSQVLLRVSKKRLWHTES